MVDLTDDSLVVPGPSAPATEVIDVESREWHPPAATPYHSYHTHWGRTLAQYSDSDSEGSDYDADRYDPLMRSFHPPFFSAGVGGAHAGLFRDRIASILPLFLALSR